MVKGLATLCMVGGTLTSCDKVNDKLAKKSEISCVLQNGQEMQKIRYDLFYDIQKRPKLKKPARNDSVYYLENGEILSAKIVEVLPETVILNNGKELSKDDIFGQPRILPDYGYERKIRMHFNRELSDSEINFIVKNSPDIIAQHVGGSDKYWETNPIQDDEFIVNVRIQKNNDPIPTSGFAKDCMKTGDLNQGFPNGRNDFFGVPIVK